MSELAAVPPVSLTPAIPLRAGDKASAPASGFARELQAVADTEKSTRDEFKPASGTRVSRKGAEVSAEITDFSLGDFIDIINPLQHIPVVGEIYREITGDEIRSATKITGDILYAGLTGGLSIVGAAISVFNEAYTEHSGESPTMAVANAILGDPRATTTPTGTTMVADADPKPEAAPTAAVQLASLAADKTDKAETPAKKPPFGGVMDTNIITQSPQLAMLYGQEMPQSRVGNVIYASPAFTNAAKLRMAEPVPASPTTTQAVSAADAQLAAQLARPKLMQPGERNLNSQTLGQLMQESAQKAQKTGSNSSSLPPALVQDMMLMALDKYKGANGLAASELELMN